jgi:hypothetical protein
VIINHWSCTKFAKWILGNKPNSGTHEEWEEWRKSVQSIHPIRFWIAEEALDKIQRFLYLPCQVFYNLECYIQNRFVSHSHALTAHKTHIKRGQWTEISDRMLPCLFDELVNFVEIDLAYQFAWSDEDQIKYNIPRFEWPFTRHNHKEAGIASLNWASKLRYGKDDGIAEKDDLFGKLTSQAVSAREIKKLYIWYTQKYANRKDPYEVSGWLEWCETHSAFSSKRQNGEYEILEKLRKIEEEYELEDTEMLCRLIKIRQSLWT